jgi:multiple sugar transport system permease protein
MRKPSVPTLLSLPMLLLLYSTLVAAFVMMIYLAFLDWTPMRGAFWQQPFYGLGNFTTLFTDGRFLAALSRSIFFVIVCGGLEFLIGLGLAMFLAGMPRLKKIFTSIWMMPMMLVPATVGYMFYLLFFEEGPINGILSLILSTPVTIKWVSHPILAYIPIIVGEVWHWTPFMFLVLYAGILALPEEPFRAARILGASEWQIFKRLTLPMLKPIIGIAILIRGLELFKLFDVPFMVTKGGPGHATETLSIWMYYQGFKFWKLSYIAAASLLILIAIVLVLYFFGGSLVRVQKEER